MARRNAIRPEVRSIYHCTSRCARQLPQFGRMGDQDFTQRREWVLQRLRWLCSAFAISVMQFALLENHLHLLLRSEPGRAKPRRMSDYEVARRWLMAFPGTHRWDGLFVEPDEEAVRRLARNRRKIRELRRRLSDVSWFHKALKEPISRRINLETGHKGTLWEGPFKCRELIGERAVLTVALYNDLNLLRAGECVAPWDSPFCSAGSRWRAAIAGDDSDAWLAPLELDSRQDPDAPAANGRRATDRGCLNMTSQQYHRLLLWAATIPRAGKASLPEDVARLLEQQALRGEAMTDLLRDFPRAFRRVMGSSESMAQRAAENGRRWLHGQGQADRYFPPEDGG